MKQNENTIKALANTFFLLVFFSIFFITQASAAENPTISVDFNNELAPISDQVFGQGMEIPFLKNIWDKTTGFDQEKAEVARDMGFTNVRFGGNTCKQFNWKEASVSGFTSLGTTYFENIDQWSQYASLLGEVPLSVCVNLHLTPQDSADMVRYANIDHEYNIKNWEMGNEEYSADQYLKYAGAEEYINDARIHCQAMKAVDPTIKCGIHAGFAAGGQVWTDDALFSAVRPGDFDFLVDHNYQPNGYFNYLSIYSNATKVDQELNLESGIYKIGFHAIGQQAPLISDPIPTLQICLDDVCQQVDITEPTSDWFYYSSDDFTIETAANLKLKMEIFDDYYDYATQQDKNIFLAEVRIVKDDGSILQTIELVDRKAWTYSFLASNLSTEDNLDRLKNIMLQYGLSLPIYETEFGWQYGSIAYPEAGIQYDWRSGLFDALHLQSLINKQVPQANLWTDLANDNWRYYTDDSRGKIYWPRFYVFKLMKEKTGDTAVSVDTENMPTYDVQEFTTQARQNIPYLSIIASKKGNKNYINVINRNLDEPIVANIKTNGIYSAVVAYEIAPASIEGHPYRDDDYKENIEINEKVLPVKNSFEYSFKPFSITTFEFFPPDTIAPVITESLPEGQLPAGTSQAIMQLITDENAICRYSDQAGLIFASSTSVFSVTGSTTHDTTINSLSNGSSYKYYIRCQDMNGNANIEDHIISFSVAMPVSGGGGGGGGGGGSVGGGGGDASTINAVALPIEADISTTTLPQEIVKVLGIEKIDYSVYQSLFGLESGLADAVSQAEAEMVINRQNGIILGALSQKIYDKLIDSVSNKLTDPIKKQIAYFIESGTPTTLSLGAGERAGALNSYFFAFGSFPATNNDWQDVIKIANGRWPVQKSKTAEDRAVVAFKKIYLRAPDMNKTNDNAAVTVISYGLRPVNRNMESEKAAIKIFKAISGYYPATAVDWDMVRAIAYSGAVR